ncbi:integral membrane sensor signal transduction histidine kinase [Thermincola ferriacetica]|uniref:histidine kinase n=1 Tax=Thermincola ferriacetica TaxID=281456 RepID=A0A0L6W5B3_9FIRM|nr:ATP-binding protein [Thermincola ferriacetica]KNZ70553.1 integral membrane sensor signal transduction histidine kinase [Thermincola ferriacetica]
MMFRSIVFKLWITIFALTLGILLVFSLFLYNRIEDIYFSNQVQLMNERALQWKQVMLSDLPPEKIQDEAEFWGKVSRYKITVFDKRGIVQYSSDVRHSPIGMKSSWKHFKAGIEGKETYYTGYSPEFNTKMTATFMPFEKNGEKYLIMVHAPTDDLLEIIKATRRTGLEVLILFFILSGILAWHFSFLIARPIINIKKVAMNMAKGDFSTLVENRRKDELGELAQTINTLSVQLKKTLDYLSRSNAELNSLLKKWKEFVADVSHELRTPLFLIQGYSEAIIEKVVDDEKTREEYLKVINKESLRLQKLVNDLLAVEGGLPLKKTPVSLYNLVAETIAPFEIKAKDKKITIIIDDCLDEIGPVLVDADRFGEVIYNLIDNAIRHTPEGGLISIAGAAEGNDRVRITFSNTGQGIPAEHLPYLFERFYRVDKARSRAEGGTGLGLAIVKRIVEQHNGKIRAESKEGKGATFIITLPRT